MSIYDGTTIPGCNSYDQIEWTYNNGQLLAGAAYLYNLVFPRLIILLIQTNGDATWQSRLNSLISAAQERFFANGVLWEPACETNFNCDKDQFCFKGFLAQYMATTTQLASYTAGTINPLLATTASTAAKFCNQGANNTQCTMWWTTNSGPLTIGVGQQMSALNVFNANMLKFMKTSSVTTANSGGTSQGNPNAGSTSSDQLTTYHYPSNKRLMIGLPLQRRGIKLLREY